MLSNNGVYMESNNIYQLQTNINMDNLSHKKKPVGTSHYSSIKAERWYYLNYILYYYGRSNKGRKELATIMKKKRFVDHKWYRILIAELDGSLAKL